MPCLRLKDCRVAALLAMTRKSGRFCLKTNGFYFLRLFFAVVFCVVAPLKFETFRFENRFIFQKNLPNLSLRGGRVRPTRQSLTMRFAIPKRNMAGRNDAADLMFFVISIPFGYVLPCFATGCHTFGFQIATAAMRPRNDTKNDTFLLATRGI